MDSPVPMLVLVILYLIVVRYGPRIMESRQPIEMKTVMVIYNLGLVLLSLYMSLEVRECVLQIDYILQLLY